MSYISDITLHIFLILPYPSYNQIPHPILQTIKKRPVSHLLHMWGPATEGFHPQCRHHDRFCCHCHRHNHHDAFYICTISLNPSNKMPDHFIVPILQMSKIKCRATEWFAQEYAGSKWQSWKLDLAFSGAKPQIVYPVSGVGQGCPVGAKRRP